MTAPRPSSRVNIASSSGVAAEKRAPLKPLPGDEIKPLSGNPYYDVILPKSAVGPGNYNMSPVASLKLPSAEIPTVLNYGGKSWDLMYHGRATGRKFFNCGGWRKFAEDNCLKIGDACVFELMERSQEKLVFDVQILRGDIPPVFLEREETIGNSAEETIGTSAEDPIIID